MLRRRMIISTIGRVKMEKEKYTRTELEILKFQTDDVITTSGFEYEEDEISLVK